MRKKFFLWSVLGIMLCIFAVLCVGQFSQIASQNKQEQETAGSDVPEDIIKCLTDFLEALKVSTEDSAQYAYFPR
jgi:adenylate cyclase class IV